MSDEIKSLIAKLRHDVLVGGGYADISSDDLERLVAEIEQAEHETVGGSIDLRPAHLKPGTMVSLTLPEME